VNVSEGAEQYKMPHYKMMDGIPLNAFALSVEPSNASVPYLLPYRMSDAQWLKSLLLGKEKKCLK
jgi:hypothetical protein